MINANNDWWLGNEKWKVKSEKWKVKSEKWIEVVRMVLFTIHFSLF